VAYILLIKVVEVIYMTYECTVKKGHIGAGKHIEEKIFVIANDVLEAMKIAMNRGGVKKGRGYEYGQSIVEVKKIS
jgi:hypothetical protein